MPRLHASCYPIGSDAYPKRSSALRAAAVQLWAASGCHCWQPRGSGWGGRVVLINDVLERLRLARDRPPAPGRP